ncbi:MAG: AAA family ATPase [Rhodothermaceae bacterium]|nr:AAA family ATPase [Rhodothermaceae bacterium]MBC14246.1 AAA family ATPase [Rhodothermaceae bacterium]
MPPSTLGDRLDQRRHRRFVGRAAERSRLTTAFADADSPVAVVHVYGPGGIGKSALLDEAARLAVAAGRGVARIDGRDVEPAPASFAAAAHAALDALGDGPRVLLVDTFEPIQALDGWLRRRFVPSLRATDLIVVAGRVRPAAEWRADYADAVLLLPLRNFVRADAEAFLEARGLAPEARGPVLAFTHGHPLALALAAEHARQPGAAAFDPSHAPDLLADLLARFVEAVPSPAHRAALEAASVVRSLTVPLLAALLEATDPGPDPDALFAWLRDLAFVASDADGVSLHDVVRETVEADLGWRDGARHARLQARARQFFADALQAAPTPGARHLVLADFLHLYRHHPVAGPLLARLRSAWADAEIDAAVPLAEGEVPTLRALAATHLGDAEADRVAGWLDRRPEAAEVYHTRSGGVAGFLLTLPLEDLDPGARSADAVTAAVWEAVSSRLREGETALLFRCWVDAEAGQGVSAVQALVFARTVERYLTESGLAASVLLTTEADLWGAVLGLAGLSRWPDAEAPDGPAAFGKDWRATPPHAWLDALASRAPSEPPPPPAREAVVVLSEEAFTEAVRDALRAYAQPHQLAASPLLRARLVRERGGDPVEALRALIDEAAAELARGGREQRYFRALDRTYLHPEPTQADAAEALDLPFSTFRRHLGRGIDHVVSVLWRAEVGG